MATEGIEKVTMRKVAEGCGLTTPYIYQCYDDMSELLEDAYIRIDLEVANLMNAVTGLKLTGVHRREELEKAFWTLWSLYWKFLMDDADKAIFSWRYYQSGYYGGRLLELRRDYYKELTDFVSNAGEILGAPAGVKLNAIVADIIDDTASMAVKMLLGYADKDALTPRLIYQSVFSLLFHLLGMDVWNDSDGGNEE